MVNLFSVFTTLSLDYTTPLTPPAHGLFDVIQNIIQTIGNISIVLLILFLIKLCLDKNKLNEVDKKAINKKIIIVISIIIVIIVLTTLVGIITHATQPLLYSLD